MLLGKTKALGFPFAAKASIIGPPGYLSPNILAVLSKASPAASSIVSPITRISRGESQSTNWVCPPETVKHKKGKLGFGSSIR